MSIDELLAEVLSLPAQDRARFADELLSSLEESQDAIEAAWVPELERRAREIEEGRIETIPWEEVQVDIAQHLARKRSGHIRS